MFLIHSIDGGRACGLEYLPCGEGAVKAGQLFGIGSEGRLTWEGISTEAKYLCMCEKESVEPGELIPVVRLLPDMVLETVLEMDAEGDMFYEKKGITSGLVLEINETGCAEIVWAEGTKAGCKVHVRFN